MGQRGVIIKKGFNPTMVRLLPSRYLLNRQPIPCFNPTMVRLLLNRAEVRHTDEQFQSHNGAIAALALFQQHR